MSQENVEVVRPIYAALNVATGTPCLSDHARRLNRKLRDLNECPRPERNGDASRVQSFFEEYVRDASTTFSLEPEEFIRSRRIEVVVFVNGSRADRGVASSSG